MVGKCDRTKGSKLESLASPVHWDSSLSALSLEIRLLLSSGCGVGRHPSHGGLVNYIRGQGGSHRVLPASVVS